MVEEYMKTKKSIKNVGEMYFFLNEDKQSKSMKA